MFREFVKSFLSTKNQIITSMNAKKEAKKLFPLTKKIVLIEPIETSIARQIKISKHVINVFMLLVC